METSCLTEIIYSILACYFAYKIAELLWRLQYVRDCKDKHVMITGCDSGFGHEAAIRLDRLGLTVYAGCLTDEGAQALSTKCSGKMKTFILDITNTKSIHTALEYVTTHLPSEGLWGLVNNAGIFGDLGPMEWSTRKDFQRVLNVNTFGHIEVTLAFLPLLRKSCSRLIFTCSIIGRMACYGTGAYATSKYAIEAFGDVCRRSLKPYGISVHLVEPGCFITGLNYFGDVNKMKNSKGGTWKRLEPEVKAEWGKGYFEAWMDAFLQNYFLLSHKSMHLVTHAIQHALLAQHPQDRYPVGFDTRFAILIQMLPEWVGDVILMRNPAGPPTPAIAHQLKSTD